MPRARQRTSFLTGFFNVEEKTSAKTNAVCVFGEPPTHGGLRRVVRRASANLLLSNALGIIWKREASWSTWSHQEWPSSSFVKDMAFPRSSGVGGLSSGIHHFTQIKNSHGSRLLIAAGSLCMY